MLTHGVARLSSDSHVECCELPCKLCGIMRAVPPAHPYCCAHYTPRGRVLGAPSCMLSHGVSQLRKVQQQLSRSLRQGSSLLVKHRYSSIRNCVQGLFEKPPLPSAACS
jgi:hypothetical protein